MTTFQAFILGIVQGVTEFLPISSSGHLKVVEALLGMHNLEQYILFDLVCHLGTLAAIFWVLFMELRKVFANDRTRLVQICVATLPLFVLIPLMVPVKGLFGKPEYLGLFFLVTATILMVGMRFKETKPPDLLQRDRWKDALFIGLFQLIAIIPGISRSGSTISAAWMRGWERREAVVFSFLIAIPAIVGGSIFELLLLARRHTPEVELHATQYLAGFLTSAVVGYGALLLLLRLAVKEQFQYFIWYCLLIGMWALWYFQ